MQVIWKLNIKSYQQNQEGKKKVIIRPGKWHNSHFTPCVNAVRLTENPYMQTQATRRKTALNQNIRPFTLIRVVNLPQIVELP